MIMEISNEKAIEFLKTNKAHKEHISITPAEVFLGYFIDDKLVGVVGRTKNRIKCFYVLENYRRKGIGTWLLDAICLGSLTAYATDKSVNLFIKHGFKIKSQNRNGIYYLRKE